MLPKPDKCKSCILESKSRGFILTEGSGSNGVMIVGEAAGTHEYVDNLPFRPQAESGSVLESAIRSAGFKRDEFVLNNLIRCQPPYNLLENMKWEWDAISYCKQQYFDEVVSKYNPRVILACGNLAKKYLTGLHGHKLDMSDIRGYMFDSNVYPNVKVIPTLHPSFINRMERRHFFVLVRDIRLAVKVSQILKDKGEQGLYDSFEGRIDKSRYLFTESTASSVLEINKFIDFAKSNPTSLISYDIETENSKLEVDESEYEIESQDITQIQFCIDNGLIIVIDLNKGYVDENLQWYDNDRLEELWNLTKEILELPNPKAGWNTWAFDNPLLRQSPNNCKINGENLDLMLMHHHFHPDITKPGMGLQFATNLYAPEFPAWKHTSHTSPYSYGAFDVHSCDRIYDTLQHDLKLKKGNKEKFTYDNKELIFKYEGEVKNCYQGYMDDVVKLNIILEDISNRGLPVSEIRRDELKREIKKRIVKNKSRMDELYPDNLKVRRPVHGFVKIPKEVFEVADKFYNREKRKEYVDSDRNTTEFTLNHNNLDFNKFLSYLEIVTRLVGEDGRRRRRKGGRRDKGDKENSISTDNENFTDQDKAQYKIKEDRVKLANEIRETKAIEDAKQFSGLKLKYFAGFEGKESYYRFCRVKEFRPNSSKQILSYVRYRNHEIPKGKNVYGEMKETANKEQIQKLYEKYGDEIYKLAIENRELAKLLGTYISGKGWKNLQDINEKKVGRVHTRFTFLGATGQLTSRNPNVQNVPKHSDLAYAFRRSIVSSSYDKTLMECVAPETKILTEEFEWKKAEDLKVGDKLVGFDEKTNKIMRAKRYLQQSIIISMNRLVKPRYKITTEKGEMIVSNNHYWLAREKVISKVNKIIYHKHNLDWIKTENLKAGDKISYLTDTWEKQESFDAGWMSGFLDGEGYTSRSGIGFGQNSGLALNKALRLLKEFGLEAITCKPNAIYGYKKYMITGFPYPAFRAIGMFRPIRLLDKLKKNYIGLATWGKNSKQVEILKIEKIEDGEVIAIQTTTKTYIAEGFMSHNCDYSSFHALTLGFEAEDSDYIRLVRADVHSYVAAHLIQNSLGKWLNTPFLKRPDKVRVYNGTDLKLDVDKDELEDAIKDLDNWTKYTDDELKKRLKVIKSKYTIVRDKNAKVAILGIGFGMGVRKFYNQNKDSFENEKDAKFVHDLLRHLFPELFEFQDKIRFIADEQKYLVSRYGFIRRFYDVFDRRKVGSGYSSRVGDKIVRDTSGELWKIGSGKDSEKCIAFLPANDAFGRIKEAMRELWEYEWKLKGGLKGTTNLIKKYGCVNQIHDSLLFEINKSDVKEARERVTEVMERKSKVLVNKLFPNGLSCKIEIKVGNDWANMNKI